MQGNIPLRGIVFDLESVFWAHHRARQYSSNANRLVTHRTHVGYWHIADIA